MTTIIADRVAGVMVADSMVTTSGGQFSTHKIYRVGSHLLGFAGDAIAIQRFRQQYEQTQGAVGVRMTPLDSEEGMEGLVLTPEGLFFYDQECVPIQVDDHYYAVGAGGPSALAAMKTMELLGVALDPALALQVACEVSLTTGGPIEVEYLNLTEGASNANTKRRQGRPKK